MSQIKNFETLYAKFSNWDNADLVAKSAELNKEISAMVNIADLDKLVEQIEVIAVILKERQHGAQ